MLFIMPRCSGCCRVSKWGTVSRPSLWKELTLEFSVHRSSVMYSTVDVEILILSFFSSWPSSSSTSGVSTRSSLRSPTPLLQSDQKQRQVHSMLLRTPFHIIPKNSRLIIHYQTGFARRWTRRLGYTGNDRKVSQDVVLTHYLDNHIDFTGAVVHTYSEIQA